MFKVTWTGSYPYLCMGRWIIMKDGKDVSDVIPRGRVTSPMDTFNTYHIYLNWQQKWESYKDGLKCNDWIKANPWINKICDSEYEKTKLYYAINAHDWRRQSCGGCLVPSKDRKDTNH